jgi:hypothetical protein
LTVKEQEADKTVVVGMWLCPVAVDASLARLAVMRNVTPTRRIGVDEVALVVRYQFIQSL